MRKTILFGLAAAMLATACSEEDDLRQGIAGEGITFTSSVMSRATDTSFEPRDAIGISMYADEALTSAVNVQYVTEDGSAFTSQNPVTWGMAGGAATADFVGVYPYKANAVANGIYNITLSTEEGASLSENDVMYAKNTSGVGEKNVNLNFSHKLVKVVMQIYDENGNGISGAQVKINNQQTTGTLNLADGTVATTGAADQELQFASNSSITGQYQTIVMPSEAMQGRIITITYNGNDYPCPVDAYVFETGKRIVFSATINSNGAVSPGQPTQVSADVTDWYDVVIESGWIFGEGEQFEVTGKTAYELATNVALNSTATEIGEFEGMLDANDVYSLEYTIEEAADGAAISISGKPYSLPAGKASGTILIAVGENTTGISVSSENTGITLTKVSVYTNESIGLPIVLWTGNGTDGNGMTEGGEESAGYEPAGWRKIIAQFTLTEEQKPLFKPGATLKCYYSADFNCGALFFELFKLLGSNVGKQDEENHVLSTIVNQAFYEEIQKNNYRATFVMDWGAYNGTLNRIELIPASGEENFDNLLWYNNPCMMDYGRVDVCIPASLAEGDVIRVHCQNVVEGAKLKGCDVTWTTEEVLTPLLEEASVSQDETTVDFAIDGETLTALQATRAAFRPITLIGNGLTVTKVELVRAAAE